jgi:hypothetical protein
MLSLPQTLVPISSCLSTIKGHDPLKNLLQWKFYLLHPAFGHCSCIHFQKKLVHLLGFTKAKKIPRMFAIANFFTEDENLDPCIIRRSIN